MKERGFNLVGTVTDGEFCSLRSRGERGALHLWQLIHDAKESVQKLSKTTLLEMLIVLATAPDGMPVVARPNAAAPHHVLLEIQRLINNGLRVEDAITNIRGKLVSAGYTPYPFRKNTNESFLDKLRSLVATYTFRSMVRELQESVDFTCHLYVPEVDPVTRQVRHDRADHNHLLKRIAQHVRDGGYDAFDYEAFADVLADPQSGLTHAALVGKRRQSVKDAERLMSYSVVKSLERHGKVEEAKFIRVVAQWHESSDGRGLSQLQRCRYNYQMLHFILEEWMPWYKECYDFSTIDINRQFSKRMDMDLPFYYWTLNERFSDEAYPSFDARPNIDDADNVRNHPLRLHRLRINQREDSSIFVVGRAHLPARHRQTIRQSFHRPGNYLAPPPNPET